MAIQLGGPFERVYQNTWVPVTGIDFTPLPAVPQLSVVAQSAEEIQQNGFRLSLAGAFNTAWLVESSADL